MSEAQSDDFVDYDALIAEHASLPPSFTFRLGGREWTCKPQQQISGVFLDDLAAAITGDQGARVKIEDFFSGVLVHDEVEAFVDMINEPNTPLTRGVLEPLMQQVTTKAISRPTERPSASSGGSRKTGRTSRAGSSSRATKARTA